MKTPEETSPSNLIPFDAKKREEREASKPKREYKPIDLADIEHAGMVARESAVVAHLRAQGLIP